MSDCIHCQIQKPFVLLVGAEPHHIFNAGTIVPTAIEDPDLPSSREVLDVALHEELGLFAI